MPDFTTPNFTGEARREKPNSRSELRNETAALDLNERTKSVSPRFRIRYPEATATEQALVSAQSVCKNTLLRVLGVTFGLAVAIGGTIGIGILRVPRIVASQVGTSGLIMMVWIAGGLYAFAGANVPAELGTMLPLAKPAHREPGSGSNELVQGADGMASLASSEFEVFSRAHPDENYKWHVRFINEIGPAKGEIAARAVKEYPLKHGEEHWIHDEASIMGPLFGHGAQHLVKWDGTNVTILQEAFGQWIS